MESFLEKPLNMPCIYLLSLNLSVRKFVLIEFKNLVLLTKCLLWRNRLARSAVNRKVGG